MTRTIGIIGTGLIGGSIGLRARELGVYVFGADVDPDTLAQALRLGAVDERVTRGEVYAQSEIVVLAMPVRAVVAELESLDPSTLGHATTIIDVASVKLPVVRAAQDLPRFVGTHPMAGTEKSGAQAADPALFEGKTWAFVPGNDASANDRIAEFIEALGAIPVAVDAQTHDATVACTSHMPQIFAWLFAERIGALRDPLALALCGPVARELMRIGSTRPQFWDDILQSNSANIEREVLRMARSLERYIRKTP